MTWSEGTGTPSAPDAAERAREEAADHRALLESVSGRPEAFRRLVERHAERCLHEARSVLRDEQLAQDSVQEAYLDLWRHAGRFDASRAPLGAWLLMITRRRAVDRVRKEQRQPRPVSHVPDVPGEGDLQQDALRALLCGQTVALLRELSDVQRRCLVLAYWGGHTMAEIAVLTDTPIGTVKTRCKAALHRLRQLVQEQGLDRDDDDDSAWGLAS